MAIRVVRACTARRAPFTAPTWASSRPKWVSSVTMPLGFMPPCYLLATGRNDTRRRTKEPPVGAALSLPFGLVIRHRWCRRGRLLFRDVRDERFGRQQHGGDARRVLQRRTGHLGRVDDPGLHHVGVLALIGVEALALRQALDLLHHDRAFPAGVVDDLTQRLLERAAHQLDTGGLVAGEVAEVFERLDRMHEHGATAWHDAFLDRGPGGGNRS